MKKQIFILFITIIFCLTLSVTASASRGAEEYSRVVDSADLLTDTEESKLRERLDSISEKHTADVVIVTVESTEDESPMDVADDFFDYCEYGLGEDESGVLLLISIKERDWWISTKGMCISAFSDGDIEEIGDLMSGDLRDGEYFDAFETYADECEYYLEAETNGTPFNVVYSLGISLIVGLVVAFVVTAVMRSQLKSVMREPAASSYVKKGSMHISDARELFLYRQIMRREKPKNNSSTHRSSSGSTHGGGGGKF